MATLGMSAADKDAIEAFRRDVVEPSMTSLVILDFWAEWCGPCKALTPVLEKVAAAYEARGVKLAKINVDENKLIAAQFRVQSIPTVYALFQGQLVADLTPARTERELGRMLDQILAQLPVQPAEADPIEDIASLVAMGEDVLAAGDAERAVSIFSQIAEMAPENPLVAAGHARALLAAGRAPEAETLLDTIPPEVAKNAAVAQVRAALTLGKEAQPVEDLGGLAAHVAADPDDHDAAYRLAGGYMAVGDRDAAADVLLASIQRDRAWKDGAARQRLLTMFNAVGLEDPWVSAQRRRLSAALFT